MIGNITVLDRIDSNTRLKGWSIPSLTADRSFRNFDVPWWVSWKELKLVAGSCVLILAWQRARRRLLTQALVGGVPGGPGPGSVLVKRVTSLAVIPRCMVLADAEQPPPLPLRALAGVAVALTPEGGRDGDGKERSRHTDWCLGLGGGGMRCFLSPLLSCKSCIRC